MTKLPRRTELPAAEFIDEYLEPRQPVVVSDEVPTWPAFWRWTWPNLVSRLGHQRVEVYDDWFLPTGSTTFAEFVADTIATESGSPKGRYVRWFARNGAQPGVWADEVFDELREDWRHPCFLPTHGYVVPPVVRPTRAVATADGYPYRAVLVSAAGARTRLHLDPWTTAAVLCQVAGTKHVQLWSPDHHDRMLEIADAPDRDAVLASIPPTYDDQLRAGDIGFIPAGWWHQVDTLTDSISLTWNFIHCRAAAALVEHVARFPDDPELDVASYFLTTRRGAAGADLGTLLAAAVRAACDEPVNRQDGSGRT